MTRVFHRLKAMGLEIDPSVYTIEQARQTVLDYLAERGCGDMALKDITLGQYFPGNTVLHRMDPRTKILLTVFYIVALFLCKHVVSYALVMAVLAAADRHLQGGDQAASCAG